MYATVSPSSSRVYGGSVAALLKCAGNCTKLIIQGTGQALVPFVVGVQTVAFSTLEVLREFILHWVQSAHRIQVDDGNGPYFASVRAGLYLLFQIDAALVCVVLGTLPILVVGIETGTVDGS